MAHIRLQTSIPGPESQKWMKRRLESVPRAVHHATPVFISHGEGALVCDVDGNQLLDFAGGIGCLNVGQRARLVTQAVHKQVDRFLHACIQVTPYDSYVRLAEELNRRTPGKFKKQTLFLNSGAEAVENAVKIARYYPGRSAILCFEDAFHGRTLLGMSLTGKVHPYKEGFGPFAPEIYRLPYAYPYRSSSGLTAGEYGPWCADQLESMFSRYVSPGSVAAVIFEPILGEGGFVVPPREFFDALRATCRKHGILLIADEVQSGYGRTGTMFACEQFGIEPDLLVAGKSIASGLPLASVTGRAEIMHCLDEGALGGTYGGNPLACEAALAVLQSFDDQDLLGAARHIGEVIGRASAAWQERFSLIGEIRGLGAMRAIELVQDRKTRKPAKEETAAVIRYCHEHGLIILSAGTYGNVIRFLVPLVVTDEQLEEGFQVIESAFAEISSHRPSASTSVPNMA